MQRPIFYFHSVGNKSHASLNSVIGQSFIENAACGGPAQGLQFPRSRCDAFRDAAWTNRVCITMRLGIDYRKISANKSAMCGT